jgi:hypothetical protein
VDGPETKPDNPKTPMAAASLAVRR